METPHQGTALFHLPGLFEFYDLYAAFLPLYRAHREYFYDWCAIGSIYGAPSDCLWAGGRVEYSDRTPHEVLALTREYGISARLTLSNSLLRPEHLTDPDCNALCRLFQEQNDPQNGAIVHAELLTQYLKKNYPSLYLVSSTTKVLTDFNDLQRELARPEFHVVIDDNEPDFQESDYSETSYEYYSDLDELGRCGVAVSNIGKDLMPTKKRGSIGKVKPSGWHTVKYDFVDGKYLYNRCHLIGYQLTAENANEKNLITGTRYMNVDGMLPFENMVADYIKETGNHVLYRVTPIYTGDNLVADGVEMEARSVEDDGDGICYHVFVYNEQPGVAIDHATGESHLAEDAEVYASQAGSGDERAEEIQTEAPAEQTQVQEQAAAASEYILNTNTMKFHRPSCSSVNQMSDSNKWVYDGTREEVLNMGYEPCKRCNP